MASPKKTTDLTEKETQVLAMAWKCFKSPPEVDFEKLAGLTGYSNPRSVGNVMTSIRKKIAAAEAIANGDAEGPSTPVKATPKAKAKVTRSTRKRKTARDDEDDSENPVTPTPSKRLRSKKATLSKSIVDDVDSGSEKDKNGIMKKEDVEQPQEADDGIVD
ncbi:hypothetical protein F4677DRAFT_432457 [Hypoxylon crocopeplum]|nr:hypothetical protein F4677DRAFT_432457 [Hypoxylon crocopeplum]